MESSVHRKAKVPRTWVPSNDTQMFLYFVSDRTCSSCFCYFSDMWIVVSSSYYLIFDLTFRTYHSIRCSLFYFTLDVAKSRQKFTSGKVNFSISRCEFNRGQIWLFYDSQFRGSIKKHKREQGSKKCLFVRVAKLKCLSDGTIDARLSRRKSFSDRQLILIDSHCNKQLIQLMCVFCVWFFSFS